MHKKLKVGKFFWRGKKIWMKKKKNWVKKNLEKRKKIFSKNKSCLKLPELPRNHIWVGGGVLPWMDDVTE